MSTLPALRADNCRARSLLVSHSYEQLRSVPVVLAMMLAFVPLTFDGRSVNTWTFALCFHAFYFGATTQPPPAALPASL